MISNAKYILHSDVCWSLWAGQFRTVKLLANIRAKDFAIGYRNQLLHGTRNAADMRMFKAQTIGADFTIMGRSTADSIAADWQTTGVVLPNRAVAVMSKAGLWLPDYTSSEFDYGVLVVAGGSQVYKLLMPQCHQALVTVTKPTETHKHEPADALFPVEELRKWLKPVSVQPLREYGHSKLMRWQSRYLL